MGDALLFIAYQFPPYAGVGGVRSAKFAKYLPQFGYRPHVLTCAVEDIEGRLDPTLLAELDAAVVHRCRGRERLIAAARRLGLYRLARFLLRPDNLVGLWNRPACRHALRLAAEVPFRAIYTSVGPFSSVVLGATLRRRLNIPWIVDYRDPWTDEINHVWPSKLHYRWECRQEARALRRADAVVVVAPTMKQMLVDRYPFLAGKVHVITNGFDAEDFGSQAAPDPAGPLRIGFAGSLGHFDSQPIRTALGPLARAWKRLFAYRHGPVDQSTHSPYYLLHAVAELLRRRPELHGAVELEFVGHFAAPNRALAAELGLAPLVRDRDYVSKPLLAEFLAGCDVVFQPMVSFPGVARSWCLSTKFYEYLGARRPVLAAVPPGDLKDLVEEGPAGWWVDPYDIPAIARLVEDLVERKQQRRGLPPPPEDFVHRFDRRRLAGELATLLDRVRGVVRSTDTPRGADSDAEQTALPGV